MLNAPIRIAIVMAFLSMAAVVFTQVYLVNLTLDNNQQQFNHSVQMALRNVTESVCQVTGVDVSTVDPIHQISSNYFIVRTDSRIDLEALEYHLKAEFGKREIDMDFEYGVYDCQSESMIYGNLVSLSGEVESIKTDYVFPELDDFDYYFGVYFPSKSFSILWQIDWWKYTSIFTVLILFFFSYTLFIMLKQKRLGAVQRDFVNNVTHELKTPLATLKIASEVIKDSASKQDDRMNQYGEIISTEVGRLEKHVDQLLRSALAEGKTKVELKPIDLSEIFRAVNQRINWGSKNVNLDVKPGVKVNADQYLLETIIFNLLENALKYGGDEVKLSVTDTPSPVLSVFDSGPGIPSDQRTKIFKKFYRVPSGDRHDVKGFGLGLFLSKESAKKMNAVLSVQCEKGTEFLLKFPTI